MGCPRTDMSCICAEVGLQLLSGTVHSEPFCSQSALYLVPGWEKGTAGLASLVPPAGKKGDSMQEPLQN